MNVVECFKNLPFARARRRDGMAMLFLTVALLAGAVPGARGEGFVSSADTPGPALPLDILNESIIRYNEAVALYEEGRYDEALKTMRAAVRARMFSSTSKGFAFSNLCLMYLTVGKFANAEAACGVALVILPNYVPAVLNLERARRRESPVVMTSSTGSPGEH